MDAAGTLRGALFVVLGLVGVSPTSTAGQELQDAQSVVTGPACLLPDAPSGGHLRGTVVDLLTQAPLAGMDVILVVPDYTTAILARTLSGNGGVFDFCGVPLMEGLFIRAGSEGQEGRLIPVPVEPVVDFGAIQISWSVAADLTGVVLDAETGEPLADALVTVEGRPVRARSQADGRFRLSGQGAGSLILRTQHMGFAERVDTLDVASGDQLALEIRLATQPIALAPLVVQVRTREATEARAYGARFDVMTREKIDAALPRMNTVADLVREARIPGVIVTEGADGPCVGSTRSGLGCAMVEVYINGVRSPNPEFVLGTLDPNTVERIQFFQPIEARFRFQGDRIGNGALLIFQRRGN